MSGIVAQNVGRPSGLIKAAAAAGGGGTWVEIKSLTASGDGDLSFVDGTDDVVLDSTYPIYVFKFINIHAETANADFTFNGSTDTGSTYDTTKTSTWFETAHAEADDETIFTYQTSLDLAQSTAFNKFSYNVGIDNDKSTSGYLYLFNPSSAVFVKHFMASGNLVPHDDYSMQFFVAGYMNTTSAVDAMQFKFDSGNIDSGKIKLFGIKDS